MDNQQNETGYYTGMRAPTQREAQNVICAYKNALSRSRKVAKVRGELRLCVVFLLLLIFYLVMPTGWFSIAVVCVTVICSAIKVLADLARVARNQRRHLALLESKAFRVIGIEQSPLIRKDARNRLSAYVQLQCEDPQICGEYRIANATHRLLSKGDISALSVIAVQLEGCSDVTVLLIS